MLQGSHLCVWGARGNVKKAIAQETQSACGGWGQGAFPLRNRKEVDKSVMCLDLFFNCNGFNSVFLVPMEFKGIGIVFFGGAGLFFVFCHKLGWPRTCYAAQNGLKTLSGPPVPASDSIHVPECLALDILFKCKRRNANHNDCPIEFRIVLTFLRPFDPIGRSAPFLL